MSNNTQTTEEKKEISINSTKNETLPNGVTTHTLLLFYLKLKEEFSKPEDSQNKNQIKTLSENIVSCVRPQSKYLEKSNVENILKTTHEFLQIFQIEDISHQED